MSEELAAQVAALRSSRDARTACLLAELAALRADLSRTGPTASDFVRPRSSTAAEIRVYRPRVAG